jgi:protein TonB
VIAVTIITILALPEIHFNIKSQSDEYELKPIELSNLIDLEESYNRPQPKAEEEPTLKDITKFTPPKIVADENMPEIQKELQETAPTLPDSTNTSSPLTEDSLLHKEIAALNTAEEDDSAVIDITGKKVEFSNEKAALIRYIYQNIHYPQEALKQRINGRVICSFIINEDGSVSDITLVQGVYGYLDDEVLRVIRSIQTQKPVMKDGKPVKTKCIVPVVFKIKN